MDKLTEMTRLSQDPEFRARVKSEPAAALAELGVRVPPGAVEFRVLEDRADVRHVVLPPDPNARLADSSLASVAGGVGVLPTDFASAISCLFQGPDHPRS